MGYIAPITQFEYIQYANRTIEAERKPRIVDGTTPIQLIRFDQVLEDETKRSEKFDQFTNMNQDVSSGTGRYKNHLIMKAHEEIQVEMTGKGGYVNEMA
ncbi:hypothetical protein ACQKL5_06105 [Peribacillus sp. NPDC097675]|uniref:hypothetical protein n=1 Tax=Peribacillus sp. NPDC097675 TaxID=3390618 RepID=UPI003D010D8F